MLDLVASRDYAAITVDDLIERADCARATFYAHYTDKDDLFLAVFDELNAELIERLLPTASMTRPSISGQAALSHFEHAAHHRRVYVAVLRGAAGAEPRRRFEAILLTACEELFARETEVFGLTSRVPLDVVARMWVGQFVALLSWWLDEEPQRSAAELTKAHLLVTVHGQLWAEGFAPGQVTFDEQEFDRMVAERAQGG
jgi:AcrR family transcriptional regulator